MRRGGWDGWVDGRHRRDHWGVWWAGVAGRGGQRGLLWWVVGGQRTGKDVPGFGRGSGELATASQPRYLLCTVVWCRTSLSARWELPFGGVPPECVGARASVVCVPAVPARASASLCSIGPAWLPAGGPGMKLARKPLRGGVQVVRQTPWQCPFFSCRRRCPMPPAACRPPHKKLKRGGKGKVENEKNCA